MILKFLMDFLKTFISNTLTGMTDVDIEISADVFDGLSILCENLSYVFPIKQLAPLVVIDFMLVNFKLFWALFLRAKSFIPGMGD
mgnify:CR=1 FL=1